MGVDIVGFAVERAYLQIFEDEVMGQVIPVEGVFDGEGVAHIHAHLLAEWACAVLGDSLVGALIDIIVGVSFRNGGVAVTTHQGQSAIDSEDILLGFSHHPFLATQDVGDIASVVTCAVPLALGIAVFRFEHRARQHAIKAIIQITLQGEVNAIVAACTLVDQCPVLIEKTVIHNRISGAFLHRYIKEVLPVGLYLQHGILAQTLGEGRREVV